MVKIVWRRLPICKKMWYNDHSVVIVPAHTGFCAAAKSRALKSAGGYRSRWRLWYTIT